MSISNVIRKQYIMPAGVSNRIQDASLIMGRVIRVQREGRGFNVVRSTSPGNREVYVGSLLVGFHLSIGNIVFQDVPLEDEKVIVLLRV